MRQKLLHADNIIIVCEYNRQCLERHFADLGDGGPVVLEPISHAQAGSPIVMSISPVTYREVSGWLRKHVAVVSMIVFLCSCSVRLFLAERADPRDVVVLYSDAGGYLAPAASLVERGAFLSSNKKPMVDRTPGYPTLIAALMLLVGRDL